MYLNTAPIAPLGKPCWRDMAELVGDKGLLPARLVALMSLKQLRRRAHEIEATHPQYREELPLVLQGEAQRRGRFTQGLRVTVSQSQVA